MHANLLTSQDGDAVHLFGGVLAVDGLRLAVLAEASEEQLGPRLDGHLGVVTRVVHKVGVLEGQVKMCSITQGPQFEI